MAQHRAGPEKVKIPYRANRAVIFNSDLFHETDDDRVQGRMIVIDGSTSRYSTGYRHRA